MNIKDLIEKVNGNDFDVNSTNEYKKYLPIEEKRKLAVGVISMCTDDLGGFVEVNKFRMKICFEMCMLKEYFGLDISKDFDSLVQEYDLVCESGALYVVRSLLSDEHDELKEILDQELNDLLEENSLQKQVVKAVARLNDIITIIGDKIKDVDISNMLPEGVDMDNFSKVLSMLK